MQAEKILKAMTSNAKYAYEFDVTDGLIQQDIIGSDGINYTKIAGLTSPFSYDEYVDICYGPKINCSMLMGTKVEKVTCQYLIDSYKSGKSRIEINFFSPITNEYIRTLYFLFEDEQNNHIMAFVVGRAIKQVENEFFTSEGQIKNEKVRNQEFFYKNIMDSQATGVLAYTYPGYELITANAEALLALTKKQSKKVNKIVTDKRILLPEDNDLNAEIAVMILSDEGFECERVNDGKKSQIPIFAMTANVMDEDKQKSLA